MDSWLCLYIEFYGLALLWLYLYILLVLKKKMIYQYSNGEFKYRVKFKNNWKLYIRIMTFF